jgi:hypothetical protein
MQINENVDVAAGQVDAATVLARGTRATYLHPVDRYVQG